MVRPTTLLATVVGLLLTPAPGPLHQPTNPVEGYSEPANYETFPLTDHFNLMPGGVAGPAPGLDAGGFTPYYPQGGYPPYPAIVPDRTFDEPYGITQ